MSTSCFGLMIASLLLLAAVPLPAAQEADLLAAALREPVLEPGTAQREIRAFINARVPPLEVPSSAAAWKSRARSLRRQLLDQVVFRGVPREWIASPVRVEWTETLTTGKGYVIRKLRYQAVPGLWIPALLYEPDPNRGVDERKNGGGRNEGVDRSPGILNVNGHVGEPGKAIEYEQLRCINLAKRGMLALHPEWFNCGELSDPEYRHGRLAYLDLCGRSGLSVFYLAMRRGLDVLAEHPRVDPHRLAMTGLSGGGWQTIWLSALDERIAATAPNAGYIGLPLRASHREDIGDLEQNPSDMLRFADYPALTAMLAPRPALLIYNEKDDCCFQTARARPSVYDPVVPFYGLFGRAAEFRFHNNVDPGTHNYDRDNREQFYRLLNDVFPPQDGRARLPSSPPENREAGRPRLPSSRPPSRQDAEIPSQDEVMAFAALRVGVPAPAGPGKREGNAAFGRLAEALMADLPRGRWLDQGAAGARRWQSAARRELASLLRYRALGPVRPEVVGESARHSSPARWRLRIGEEWTVPVVVFEPHGSVCGTAVVVAQGGREAALPAVQTLLRRGLRSVVVDLLLLGECDPSRSDRAAGRGQQAMMIGAVGERPLGIQVAQLRAVLQWAAGQFHLRAVSLVGVGRVGSIVAAASAALEGSWVEELCTIELPASLKLLVEERVEYDASPELFCFGLLERFDVGEILGMSRAKRLVLSRATGGAARVERELGPLVELRARLGLDPMDQKG